MIRVAITSLRGGAGVTALVSGMAQAAAASCWKAPGRHWGPVIAVVS